MFCFVVQFWQGATLILIMKRKERAVFGSALDGLIVIHFSLWRHRQF